MNYSVVLHSRPAAWLREGPLASCEAPYTNWLVSRGYKPETTRSYVSCLAHFANWAASQQLSPCDLSLARITSFLDDHLSSCDCAWPVHRGRSELRAALAQLLPALDAAGIPFIVRELDAVERELDCFDTFMRDRKGLAHNTRMRRLDIVGDLLRRSLDKHGDLFPIDADLLRFFIAERLERWSPASAGVLTGALRAYLRFRCVCGDDVDALLPMIGSPANWRLATLPKTLTSEEVEAVLSSFTPDVSSRYRCCAIAHCVARLGLRASEVIQLELEDLQWESGTIRLRRCKSRREDVLPMPTSVGSALVDYLRLERPVCASRRVFVRHIAPVEKPLGTGVVKRAIREACTRCALPCRGVHVFRHSLAARVLDGGGSLKEVADVLRHRNLETSQIYAKIDDKRLAAVTMPWPGGKA